MNYLMWELSGIIQTLQKWIIRTKRKASKKVDKLFNIIKAV